MNRKTLTVAICLALSSGGVMAAETDGFTQLRGAVRSLVDELVREGILPKEKANAVVERAMQRARGETTVTEGGASQQGTNEDASEAPAGSLRIPYIPEPVKQEIIEQVRPSVRQDVVQDILKQAKEERWGMPDAFPAWVNRISFFGDLRLRAQIDNFADDNASNYYPNYQRINQRRSDSGGGEDNLNTTEDQRNLRLQARVGLLAKVSESVNAIVRVSTGSTNNPVSTNHTLSNGFSSGQLVLDQGYLRYQPEKYLTLWGGRLPNPFLTTDLVWDNDVNFDGVAATFRRTAGDPTVPRSIGFQPFLTLGVFPLQTPDRGRDDKWLYATQLGFDWGFGRSKLSVGAAYYNFSNIVGQANAFNDNSLDYTAPLFVQKGNTMFLINDPFDPGHPLYGLAAEFREVDLIASLDIGAFGANHIILTTHYVKNLGFDLQEVRNRIIESVGTEPLDPDVIGEDNTGYLIKLTVGAPKLQNRGEWQTNWTYRYLGRDAVVDAYTDSDFHLGGTDAKGWILGASYAMANNAWISLRYLTSDAIKGPPLAVDTWQLDFNARF